MLTDVEPRPRLGGSALARELPPWPIVTNWPTGVRAPEADLLATLTARRSRIGGPVASADMAAVLRHATMLRSRRSDGRFGEWESRAAPAAGGLHAIALLVLPVGEAEAGLYDVEEHDLRAPTSLRASLDLNRESISTLVGARTGITIQLMADGRRYGACYEDAGSLMWRDAGCLAMLIALVATALSMTSVLIGRHGDDVVASTGAGQHWRGVGAVHLGSANATDDAGDGGAAER